MKCPFCCTRIDYNNRWQKYECLNCGYEGSSFQTTDLQKYRSCNEIDIDEYINTRLLLYPLLIGVGIGAIIIIFYTVLTSGGG